VTTTRSEAICPDSWVRPSRVRLVRREAMENACVSTTAAPPRLDAHRTAGEIPRLR